MRQLKRFSKNGIYAVSEYLDMLKEDLRNCVGVMNYRTRPEKTHLLLYFYVKSEGLRAI